LLSQIFGIFDNVSRATNNAFVGRMRPAGREFATRDIDVRRWSAGAGVHLWGEY